MTSDGPDEQDTEDGASRFSLPTTVTARAGGLALGHKVAGRYKIEGSLGRGGFGEVFLAHDGRLDRPVALKVLNPARTLDKDVLEAFVSEGRLIARLDHPHVVPVHDAGVERGTPWIVMKRVGGESLSSALSREGALPRQRTLQILSQAAAALDHAHRKGIIHRDVKPSNLLLERRDDGAEHTWLVDFGVAKLLTGVSTTGGRVVGTPAYMSPEQIVGKRVDARSDLFSLGCVASEMLTGVLPFQGESFSEIVYAVVHRAPEGQKKLSETGGSDVESVVRRMLAKSPVDRYQTAADLLRDLQELLAGQPMKGARRRFAFLRRRGDQEPWDGSQVLQVRGLVKGYRPRRRILHGLDLDVPRGGIYALLGRNGSGKTTFIRTAIGLYRRDAGSVAVFGRDPQRDGPAIRSRLGYVPESTSAYEWMKVSDFLDFQRRCYPDWDESVSYELLGDYGLPLASKLRELSKGMRTQVSLVCALAHRPELLILDDPTLGVDAVIVDQFFATLQTVSQREGTTVLIASHHLGEVEEIATHVGFLQEGRMFLSDSLERLRLRTRQVQMTFPDEVPDLVGIPHFKALRISGRRLTGVVLDTSSDALERLRGLGPEEMEIRELSLKEIFVNFLG